MARSFQEPSSYARPLRLRQAPTFLRAMQLAAFFAGRVAGSERRGKAAAAGEQRARTAAPACKSHHEVDGRRLRAHIRLGRRAHVHRLELPPLAAGKAAIIPKQPPQIAAQPCARRSPRLLGSFPCSADRERRSAPSRWCVCGATAERIG